MAHFRDVIMSTATKVTFGLAGFFVVVSVFVASYLMIRTDSLRTESINAPTREMRVSADQAAWKHRSYFRKVWLLPAAAFVLSFFGWVEYFKSASKERTRTELIGGILTSVASVFLLTGLGAMFMLSMGGHG